MAGSFSRIPFETSHFPITIKTEVNIKVNINISF